MMKLYFTPGACSLADHIALLEVGAQFEAEAVDLRTKKTASGADYLAINPKGYVPTLLLEDGGILTENVAMLDWIAEQYPQLRRASPMARTRQLEMLVFISTEIHRAYKPMWHGTEAEKESARASIPRLYDFTASQMQGDYLFGDEPSVADFYLFVTLRWAAKAGVSVPEPLLRLQWRMEQRPAVRTALAREEAVAARGRQPKPITVSVRDNPTEHRFERPIHDEAIAAAYYRTADGKLAFIHTEVPPAFSGQGIATDLARGTFDLLRQSGRKAVLICPFMVHFANTHPEYADVIDA